MSIRKSDCSKYWRGTAPPLILLEGTYPLPRVSYAYACIVTLAISSLLYRMKSTTNECLTGEETKFNEKVTRWDK